MTETRTVTLTTTKQPTCYDSIFESDFEVFAELKKDYMALRNPDNWKSVPHSKVPVSVPKILLERKQSEQELKAWMKDKIQAAQKDQEISEADFQIKYQQLFELVNEYKNLKFYAEQLCDEFLKLQIPNTSSSDVKVSVPNTSSSDAKGSVPKTSDVKSQPQKSLEQRYEENYKKCIQYEIGLQLFKNFFNNFPEDESFSRDCIAKIDCFMADPALQLRKKDHQTILLRRFPHHASKWYSCERELRKEYNLDDIPQTRHSSPSSSSSSYSSSSSSSSYSSSSSSSSYSSSSSSSSYSSSSSSSSYSSSSSFSSSSYVASELERKGYGTPSSSPSSLRVTRQEAVKVKVERPAPIYREEDDLELQLAIALSLGGKPPEAEESKRSFRK